MGKLGVGWSLVAGILVQCLMFVLIWLLNPSSTSGGYFYALLAASEGDDASSSSHYTFPLLFTLLILAIHFIAAEFTYINAVSCMLHIAPIHIVSNKTIAANSMRFITSIARICGAVFAPFLWFFDDESDGSFEFFSFLGAILFGIAFVMHLGLMLYIACYAWDAGKSQQFESDINSDEYMMSSLGRGDNESSYDDADYLFQHDADYPNVKAKDEEEMDETYIAKILSTNIDFVIH